MSTSAKTKVPILRTVLLSVTLSLAGVAITLFWLADLNDFKRLLELPAWAILGGCALLFATYLFGGARLKLLAALTGQQIRLFRATRAHILGLFSAAVTPGGSGNALAIGFSLQRDGLSSTNAWSITIYTSVLDLLFFAWAIPAAALTLSRYPNGFGGDYLVWLSLLVGLVFLTLWYLLAYRLELLIRLAARLFALRLLKRWQRRVWRFLQGMTKATATMTGSTLMTHLILQLYTALLHIGLYAIFYVFARSLGANLSLLPTMALVMLVSVVSYLIPTPGGSGYVELALAYTFTRHADASLIAPTVLAWRVLSYYTAFLLGPLLGGPVLAQILSSRSTPADLSTPNTKR